MDNAAQGEHRVKALCLTEIEAARSDTVRDCVDVVLHGAIVFKKRRERSQRPVQPAASGAKLRSITTKVDSLSCRQKTHRHHISHALERIRCCDGRMHSKTHHVLVVLLRRKGVDQAGSSDLPHSAGEARDAQLHSLEPTIHTCIGHEIRGQAVIESWIHQHRENSVRPRSLHRHVHLPRVQQAGHVAAIEIARLE